jgi:diadenosine tetraphosphate (Ap4A) HIT family hydrolase
MDMTEINKCITCELVVRRDIGEAPIWDSILRTQNWDIVHCNDTSLLGWIVVIARRHIESIDQLTYAEALELGGLLRKVSQALKKVIKCNITYVIQFAEAAGHRHVHFHIVPRMADLPEEYRGVRIFKLLGVSDKDRVSEETMNKFAIQIRRILESE